MMDYLVELNFEGPSFVAVPNRVVDMPDLSASALGVLVYLARQCGAAGARIVRVSSIMARFKMGKDKWQRIARELRAAGAISDNFGRTDGGRSIARSLSVGWPPERKAQTCKPENPAHRKFRQKKAPTCEAGNPAHRADNPVEVSRKTRPLLKEEKAARGGPPAAKPRAAENRVYKSGDRNAARFASPRSETSRAADTDGQEGGEIDPVVARRALAASLGLPFRDPVTGQWSPPARSDDEEATASRPCASSAQDQSAYSPG